MLIFSLFRNVLTAEKIKTASAEVYIDAHRHVRIVVEENAVLEKKDMSAIKDARVRLCADEPYTAVFVTPQSGSVTNEARMYASGKEVYGKAIAVAILANSYSSVIVANFFLQVHHPPAPTRLFKMEKDALAWLEDKRQEFLGGL